MSLTGQIDITDSEEQAVDIDILSNWEKYPYLKYIFHVNGRIIAT